MTAHLDCAAGRDPGSPVGSHLDSPSGMDPGFLVGTRLVDSADRDPDPLVGSHLADLVGPADHPVGLAGRCPDSPFDWDLDYPVDTGPDCFADKGLDSPSYVTSNMMYVGG